MSDISQRISTVESLRQLILALQRRDAFPHAVTSFQLLETHISWVLLTGDFAYKFKKPVNFGFVDFSTLERRRHFCEEELRLNGRLAPDIYLDVLPVTGPVDNPRIGGVGEVVEYCVRMRQFPQDQLISRLAANNKLTTHAIDELVRTVAEFHRRIPVASDSSAFGSPAAVADALFETLEQLKTLPDLAKCSLLPDIEHWCSSEVARQTDLLRFRKKAGFIRECHGDMHLGNIVLLNGRTTVFDGIEFNADLRWIDVISELAFCMMDLIHQRQTQFAWRFLNGCLSESGDYDSLMVLPLYLVYRALVRAKVAAIRIGCRESSGDELIELLKELESYLRLADRLSHREMPFLAITHGLSGSGKSYAAEQLSGRLSAVWIRSDVERKRQENNGTSHAVGSASSSDLYSANAISRVYAQLGQIAVSVIKAGYPLIVDATFLALSHRNCFRDIARDLSVPFLLIDFPADVEVCRSRIRQRRQERPNDPSDATEEVLDQQLATQEPLLPDEAGDRIPFNSLELVCHSISEFLKERQ